MIGVFPPSLCRVSVCQTLHRFYVQSLWRSRSRWHLNAIFPIGHTKFWQAARKNVKKALPGLRVA